MKTCPFFNICGGCKFDFAAPDYRENKIKSLVNWQGVRDVYWTAVGQRRRADFGFADGRFGFFARGSKDIVPIKSCPNLVPEINAALPGLSGLPWTGSGSALVTLCENGLDVNVTSNVPYFTPEFKKTAERLDLVRVTWNDRVVMQKAKPQIKFGDVLVDYPTGAFLQPTVQSETAMRDFVVAHTSGVQRVLDLFCGIGNFTFATHADGFDIAGTGVKRDLFKKPLTPRTLDKYDVVIMDPPRAGALSQCKELARSNVPRIVYVSCNPDTLLRDAKILTRVGYKITDTMAFDQFVGTEHWELAAVFQK